MYTGTSIAASLQTTRAIYWLTIPREQWDLTNPRISIVNVFGHALALYWVCSIFLYFTYLEPNYFISFLFEIFGVSCGSVLVLSVGQILTSTHKPWLFFVLNMLINLRFYVLSSSLIIPRILTFLGSAASFSLLHPKGICDMHLDKDVDLTVAVVLGIGMYSMFGVVYDCKLLLLMAIIVLCVYVSYKIWKKQIVNELL